MEKDKSKKMKRDALKSFLEANSSPAPTTSSEISAENSRITTEQPQDCQQVYLDDNNNCVVCGKELDKVKMKNGFCNMPACSDHMRKRRRKKGKFQRACDSCEDRIIYEIYTKLEAKAEESLNVEEEIITLKHQKYVEDVEKSRQKRRQIGFKTMQLQQQYEEKEQQFNHQQNMLMSEERKVESLELTVVQLEAYVTRLETSFKQNNEQDYNILSEENSRLAKELAKVQKKCQEIRASMEKKQKEIENAYLAWQQRQFKKKLENDERMAATQKKDCQIY